jgi:hypothetical protein
MLGFGEDDVKQLAIPTPDFRNVGFPISGNNGRPDLIQNSFLRNTMLCYQAL